jgi:quinol monooxygenase YgiN
VLPAFRDEPGILAFQLSQELDHTTRFIVYKKFRNQDAFQYHLQDPTIEPVIRFLQTSIKDPPFEKGYHYLIQFSPV